MKLARPLVERPFPGHRSPVFSEVEQAKKCTCWGVVNEREDASFRCLDDVHRVSGVEFRSGFPSSQDVLCAIEDLTYRVCLNRNLCVIDAASIHLGPVNPPAVVGFVRLHLIAVVIHQASRYVDLPTISRTTCK